MLIARRRTASARTASARIYPTPTSGTACVTPTPDGTGYIIHPSVVDMGPQEWNGFRWWRLDTPYANQSGAEENPCIYGSNDRINWEVPAGLTNPIDPWPGPAAGLLTRARGFNPFAGLAPLPVRRLASRRNWLRVHTASACGVYARARVTCGGHWADEYPRPHS